MKSKLSKLLLLVLLFLTTFQFPVYALVEHTYYCHTEQLGSVIAVTDENGNLVSLKKYLPYGGGVQQKLEMIFPKENTPDR